MFIEFIIHNNIYCKHKKKNVIVYIYIYILNDY